MSNDRYVIGCDPGVGPDETGITIWRRKFRSAQWRVIPDFLLDFCEWLPRPLGRWVMAAWFHAKRIWREGWGERDDAHVWKPMVFSDADMEFLAYRKWTRDRLLRAFYDPASLRRDTTFIPSSVFARPRTVPTFVSPMSERILCEWDRKKSGETFRDVYNRAKRGED